MKNVSIKGLEFMVRRNLGNYEHSEIKVVGAVNENADELKAALELRAFAEHVLYSQLNAGVPKAAPAPAPQAADPAPTTTTPAPEEKKTKAKAEKKADVLPMPSKEVEATIGNKTIEEVREEKKAAPKADKNVEKYNRDVKEHTSTLAGHLTKVYGDSWKKKEGIKEFSASLNGADFRDTKTGLLTDSFKAKIEEFFGESVTADVL